MQISARHMLKGRVKQVTPRAFNIEVTIAVPGGIEIVSMITKSSAERLQGSPGKAVDAIRKSSDVMLATE